MAKIAPGVSSKSSSDNGLVVSVWGEWWKPALRNTRNLEVFGLGGAGKTTLIELIRDECPNKELCVKPSHHVSAIKHALNGLTLFIRLVLHAPGCAFACICSTGGWWLLTKLAYRMSRIEQLRDEVPILLIDGGFIQPLVTHALCFSRGNTHIAWSSLLNVLPKPIAVIYVHCDTEVAYRRFRARELELGSLDSWGDRGGLRERFSKAASRSEEIYEYYLEQGVPTLRLESSTNVCVEDVDQLLCFLGRIRQMNEADHGQPS